MCQRLTQYHTHYSRDEQARFADWSLLVYNVYHFLGCSFTRLFRNGKFKQSNIFGYSERRAYRAGNISCSGKEEFGC